MKGKLWKMWVLSKGKVSGTTSNERERGLTKRGATPCLVDKGSIPKHHAARLNDRKGYHLSTSNAATEEITFQLDRYTARDAYIKD